MIASTGTKLEAKHTRLCDCPENHLSCITAKEWVKSQIGVWQFYYEARDIRDKKLHPAELLYNRLSVQAHIGEGGPSASPGNLDSFSRPV